MLLTNENGYFEFAEALVKMIGLRFHYFTVPWNVFDFLLVLASILGILMEDVMIDFPVSPTLLRVVRVFRIGRILRLIKVRFFRYGGLGAGSLRKSGTGISVFGTV